MDNGVVYGLLTIFCPPHALSSKTNQSEAESESAFEGFTILAVAAGMTKRLRLGHLVLGNSYRNPGLVAKMATTLDQASEGRFTLSLGASWYEREHLAYGWPFPSMKERSDRFEEACELIRLLFKSNEPLITRGSIINWIKLQCLRDAIKFHTYQY